MNNGPLPTISQFSVGKSSGRRRVDLLPPQDAAARRKLKIEIEQHAKITSEKPVRICATITSATCDPPRDRTKNSTKRSPKCRGQPAAVLAVGSRGNFPPRPTRRCQSKTRSQSDHYSRRLRTPRRKHPCLNVLSSGFHPLERERDRDLRRAVGRDGRDAERQGVAVEPGTAGARHATLRSGERAASQPASQPPCHAMEY